MGETTAYNGGGWNEWSKHVLAELERLNKNIDAVRTEIQTIKFQAVSREDYRDLRKDADRLKIEIAVLKAKSAIIGGIAGIIGSGIVALAVSLISR